MISKEALQYINSINTPDVQQINGETWSDKPLTRISYEPRLTALHLNSLTSLVSYIKDKVEPYSDEAFIHVSGHDVVSFMEPYAQKNKARETYIISEFPSPKNHILQGEWLDVETFIIALQATFEDYGDRAEVLRSVGTVKSEVVRTNHDDGITQKITASSGVTRVEEVELKNPVTLKPYRTFREIDQPESQFVFRGREGRQGEKPTFALIQADAGAWIDVARQRIVSYLKEELPNVPVIG